MCGCSKRCGKKNLDDRPLSKLLNHGESGMGWVSGWVDAVKMQSMGMWMQDDGCVENRIRSGTEKRERNKRSDTLLAQLVKGVHQRTGEGDESWFQ